VIVIGAATIVMFVWWSTGYVASQWRRGTELAAPETAALLQLLRTNRFLAVVGTSGSGKSSLVRAGLIAGRRAVRATEGFA